MERCGLGNISARGAEARGRCGIRRGQHRRQPDSGCAQNWPSRGGNPFARGEAVGSATRLRRVEGEDSGGAQFGERRHRACGGAAGETSEEGAEENSEEEAKLSYLGRVSAALIKARKMAREGSSSSTERSGCHCTAS